MKIKQLLTKTLLVAAGLLVGQSVWADVVETTVVNCDFNNGETLFTEASRITVGNDNNVKFTCAGNSTNGYSLATYDFSSAIGTDATAVKIEFLFWIPNETAAYRRFFTVGQADLRTGFGKQSYSTAGSMFAFGLARNSGANYFSINGANTTAAASAASVLGAWARAEIYVNHSAKTVNYKITNVENTTTYYSADDVAFVDGTASYCNQLDFFDCQNGEISYLDNLVITKYVDNSKVATTYTVKYQNAGGTDLKDPVVYNTYVGDTYTASASDMATFYNADESMKYVYKSGNTSTAATSTAANNVITLVFDEYAKIAYTVTAKNGATELTTIASGNAYTDGSTKITFSKYLNVSDIWYKTDETPFAKTINAAGNINIEFSPSDVVYFSEMESLTRSGGAYLTEISDSYSGGSRLRLSKGSLYYTPALSAGIYRLSIPWGNSNNSASEVYVYTRSSEGDLSDKLATFTAAEKGSGTFTCIITVPEGYSIAFNGNEGGSYNNNARMDYMIVAPASVPVEIKTTGTTFSSAYAIDCDNLPTGVTAYKVTKMTASEVTASEVTGKVAANTGLILKADEAKSYDIPVAATGEAVDGNLLKAAVTATPVAAGEAYGLKDGKFYKLNAGTISAGKAYLPATTSAPELSIVFGGTTGIADVRSKKADVRGEIYNLNGQRVAQPAKGLYIVNGRKAIIK